jgi:hypothetical protein
MDQAPQVLRFLREFMAEAPDEVGMMANLRLAPSLPIVPEELRVWVPRTVSRPLISAFAVSTARALSCYGGGLCPRRR